MTLADDFENKMEKGDMPRPIPRWLVVAKRAGLWTGLGALVVLGALALGVTLWLVSDPALREDASFFALLGTIPFMWLAASLVAALVATVAYRLTPLGYRHRLPIVVLAVFALALLAGAGLAATGIPEKAEESVSAALPPYHDLANRRLMRFVSPERGAVVGWVVSGDDGEFDLRDPMLRVWHVDAAAAPSGVVPQPGACVRVTGEVSTGTSGFVARTLRPCPRGLRQPPVNQPVAR